MAIGAEQREYMLRTLQGAIAKYYGDSVPTLKDFTNRKRKTFMEMLNEKVKATEWQQRIQAARQLVGNAKGVATKLNENHAAKYTEIRERHEREIAELRAKHQKELAELAAHYEPVKVEANQKLRELEVELQVLVRASYFAGLEAEDDGRHVRNEYDITTAVNERVNAFIENNLEGDPDGVAVNRRIQEEKLIGDAAYIANNMKELRETVLFFISTGELPKISVPAWKIKDGQDLTG